MKNLRYLSLTGSQKEAIYPSRKIIVTEEEEAVIIIPDLMLFIDSL